MCRVVKELKKFIPKKGMEELYREVALDVYKKYKGTTHIRHEEINEEIWRIEKSDHLDQTSRRVLRAGIEPAHLWKHPDFRSGSVHQFHYRQLAFRYIYCSFSTWFQVLSVQLARLRNILGTQQPMDLYLWLQLACLYFTK